MFDLMIKGASLTDDEGEFDIACKDGRIVEISKSISGESNEIIHADGCLRASLSKGMSICRICADRNNRSVCSRKRKIQVPRSGVA